MRTITHIEWNTEGERRFGPDRKKWKFVCPRCKEIQTPQDFLDAKINKDKIQGFVAFSCIGRFVKDRGCDWSLGGLFQIHELEVSTDDKKIRAFEFANE